MDQPRSLLPSGGGGPQPAQGGVQPVSAFSSAYPSFTSRPAAPLSGVPTPGPTSGYASSHGPQSSQHGSAYPASPQNESLHFRSFASTCGPYSSAHGGGYSSPAVQQPAGNLAPYSQLTSFPASGPAASSATPSVFVPSSPQPVGSFASPYSSSLAGGSSPGYYPQGGAPASGGGSPSTGSLYGNRSPGKKDTGISSSPQQPVLGLSSSQQPQAQHSQGYPPSASFSSLQHPSSQRNVVRSPFVSVSSSTQSPSTPPLSTQPPVGSSSSSADLSVSASPQCTQASPSPADRTSLGLGAGDSPSHSQLAHLQRQRNFSPSSYTPPVSSPGTGGAYTVPGISPFDSAAMPPNSSHLQGSGSQYPPYSPFPTLSSPQGGLNGGGGGGSRRGPESSHQLQQSSRSACTLPSYSPVPYSCGPSTGSLTVAPPPSSSQLLHSSRSLSSYPSSGKSTDSPSVTSSVCNTSSASYTSPSPPPLTSTSSTSPQAPGPFGSGSYLSPSSRRPLSSSQPAVITQLACQEPPGQPNRQGSGVPASPSFPVNGPGLPRPSASTRRSGKDQQTQDVPTAATFESDRDGMARLFGGDTHPATGSCEMPTSAPSKVDRGVEERRMPVPSEAGQDIRPASSGVSAPGSSTYVSAAMPPGAAAGPSSGRSEQLVGSSSSVSHAEARKSSSDGVSKSSDSHSISSPSTHADESVSSGGSNRVPIARGAGLPPPITRTVSPGGWREGARSSSGTAPGKGTHGPRAGQGGTAGQGAGRQLLKSLNFSKTLFMTEAFTDKKLNVASNTLRKNYENFVLIRNKNAIVLPGPKKAKDHPRGTIIAYNSGYIVAAATREQFVGMNLSQSAPAPSSSASTSSTDLVKKSTSSPVSLSPESSALPVPAKREAGGQSPSPIIASAPQGAPIYADWIRKKFRSHEAEPLCRDNGYTRPLTLMTRADIDPPNEIFLEELRDFIFLHFPRWFVAYDPEVAPCLVLGKQFEKMSNQILQPQLSPGSFKSFPSGSFLNPRTLGDGSPKPTGSSFVSATNEAGKSPSLPLNSAGSFPSADGSVDTSGTRPSGQYLNACAISRGGDNTGAGVSRSARILPSFSRSPSPSRYSTAFSSTRRKQGFSLLPDSSRRAASSPLRAATEAAAEAWGVDATQLLFPHLPSHSHLWPPEEKIVAWRRKEEEARAEGREYLQCIFIIGVRHVIAHGVKSQQTLFAAVSELWPLLRYFIGSPEVRFKPKTGERRADRNSAGESFSKSAEDGRDFKRRRHGGEVLASQAIAREMLQ